WATLAPMFSDLWQGIKNIWSDVSQFFNGLWEEVKTAFSVSYWCEKVSTKPFAKLFHKRQRGWHWIYAGRPLVA
ncbi:hypothetical protein, partial [Pasteurella multocida]|uniref:hypothetical protein n=1 Tax=Pasteurella multocida TaxID=747 RepID=UPI0022FFCFC3